MKTLLAGLAGGLIVLAGVTFLPGRAAEPAPDPAPTTITSTTRQQSERRCVTHSNVILAQLDCEYRPAVDYSPIQVPTRTP